MSAQNALFKNISEHNTEMMHMKSLKEKPGTGKVKVFLRKFGKKASMGILVASLMAGCTYGNSSLRPDNKSGKETSSLNSEKTTELMRASADGDENRVRVLLKNGGDVNAVNEEGVSALMLASANGHKNIVIILLNNGADVNAMDNKDKEKIRWKRLYDSENVLRTSNDGQAQRIEEDLEDFRPGQVKLGRNRGYIKADVQPQSTSLKRASENGHRDIVKLFREHGAKE